MWPQLLWPGVTFVATSLLALALRGMVLSLIARWGAPRPGRAAFGDAVRLPSFLWCLVLGLYVAVQVIPLPSGMTTSLNFILRAAIIVSVTVTVANVVGSLIGRSGDRLGGAVTGLAQTSARLSVLIVGLLVLLSAFGIEITPILTALGVGGLAVALALQDTLSNLFSGMHLLADKPIRVGDYVKVAENIEGFVVDVGWRSTRIRTLPNNVVIVPNRTVAQSVITNYDLPESRVSVVLRVPVNYGADPDRVETALVDEATQAVGEIPGLLGEPKPLARLIGFGESSLDFNLVCQAATFVEQFTIQHELRKRIVRRFAADGIEIRPPVPPAPAAPPALGRLDGPHG